MAGCHCQNKQHGDTVPKNARNTFLCSLHINIKKGARRSSVLRATCVILKIELFLTQLYKILSSETWGEPKTVMSSGNNAYTINQIKPIMSNSRSFNVKMQLEPCANILLALVFPILLLLFHRIATSYFS